MRPVTAAEMKEIERRANEAGLSYYQMMENAGGKIAECVKENTKNFEGAVCLVLCGSGNNGGDGFVAARRIKELGGSAIVMLVSGIPKTDDAKRAFSNAQSSGIEILSCDPKLSPAVIAGSDAIVDCVYGTGFHGELKPEIKELFGLAAESDAVKFSADIPSGIGDDGTVADGAFTADRTIAIDSLKYAHVSPDAITKCGRISVADIGIPAALHNI